ncbi:MAG: MarR family winged helix-turn-helix transcriptional regulator [Lachnospiraceae bacterium]
MECTVRNYGTDTPLHEAEIHMIKAIKENEGIHVTGLAEQLGVTKGAVSQIIAKLDTKEMIVKAQDANNLSRLVLRLSAKGETAYLHHEKLHGEFDSLVADVLETTSEKDRAFLIQFLSTLEEKVNRFEDYMSEL